MSWLNLNDSFTTLTKGISHLASPQPLAPSEAAVTSPSPDIPEVSAQRELATKCEILQKEVLRTRKLCQLYKERWERAQSEKANGGRGRAPPDEQQTEVYEDVDLQESSPLPGESGEGEDNESEGQKQAAKGHEDEEKARRSPSNGHNNGYGEELAPCDEEPTEDLVADSAVKEVARLQDELAKVTTDREHWRHLVTQKSESNAALQDDLRKRDSQLEELERRLDEERAARSTLEEQLREQQAQFSEEKDALEAELHELDAQQQEALDKVLAIRYQLSTSNGDLCAQVEKLKTELVDCQSTKESLKETASRIKAKVVDKEEDIVLLHDRIHELELLQAGRVDKQVMKSLLLGYFSAPGDKKQDVALLLARILDFNEDEVAKSKLTGSTGWLGVHWTGSGQDSISVQALASQFVTFLETESLRQKEQLPRSSPAMSQMARDFTKFGTSPVVENKGVKRNPFLSAESAGASSSHHERKLSTGSGNQLFDSRVVVSPNDLPMIVSSPAADSSVNTPQAPPPDKAS